jgi:hypothetical protein
MRILAATLLAIVLALAWLLYAEVTTSRQQQSQLAELTVKLSDRTMRENLELQEKCALQAEKIFHKLGHLLRSSDKGASDSFTSHYNAKLNKCFMSIETIYRPATPAGMSIGWHLLDAYEQKDYAMYASGMLKKGDESPPTLCVLMPRLENEQTCKSEREYKAFVARYME